MKKGLIMEGGALRGLFTAGVIDVMMENSIVFDGAVGVSAGAVFGCNYKSGQIGRVIRYNLTNANNPNYCGIRSLIKTGDLFGADYCYREIPEKYDIFDTKAYAENPMEFHVVCTDIATGKPIYRRLDRIDETAMAYLRASASMPLVSRIVEVDGLHLLDGGIADFIPLRYFESLGYEKNIVILTQPKGFIKEKNELLPFMKLAFRQYPHLYETMKNRHTAYNETIRCIEEKENAGDVFVIRPPRKLPIGRVEHDPQKMNLTYQIGRNVGRKALPLIKKYLQKGEPV